MSDIPLLAEGLVRLGTRCVFGIPGEWPSLELLAELEKLGCAFHLAPHEAAGALMAGEFGRVTGIPGVSPSIKGPGFNNMPSGIATKQIAHALAFLTPLCSEKTCIRNRANEVWQRRFAHKGNRKLFENH